MARMIRFTEMITMPASPIPASRPRAGRGRSADRRSRKPSTPPVTSAATTAGTMPKSPTDDQREECAEHEARVGPELGDQRTQPTKHRR